MLTLSPVNLSLRELKTNTRFHLYCSFPLRIDWSAWHV